MAKAKREEEGRKDVIFWRGHRKFLAIR